MVAWTNQIIEICNEIKYDDNAKDIKICSPVLYTYVIFRIRRYCVYLYNVYRHAYT